MGKSDDPQERQIWGTWEELLLASAVARHGARRWDSVALEIRSRSRASHLVTAQSCRQRYVDLQRRFGDAAVKARGDDDGDDGGVDPDLPSDVPWLEQLRRLRVTELRSEVERYDLSIGSLQLKVKRLQEEREQTLRAVESGDGKPEQEVKEGSSPESLAGDRISGEASGPSVEQSNSTDLKQKSGEDGRDLQEAAAGAAGEVAQPSAGGEEKPVEGSYNGSTGSQAAAGTALPQAMGESGESIAESKGGEVGGGEKESSDVQSSASLSRLRKKVVSRGRRRGGGEPETEEVSIMSMEAVAELQPLIAFLEIFRSDKYGSVFERRLESQESSRYRSLVRQHVDLQMVRAKLDRVVSGRSYSAAEFFRDLLLLCTNAIVFYPKASPEAIAAVHLRRLVAKEMGATCRTSKESARPAGPLLPPQPKATASNIKPEPDLAGTLTGKPISSVPLKVCRKRSSISTNQAAAAAKEERDERPDPARKESDGEEKSLPKNTTKERLALSGTTRGLRTNKVRGGNGKGVPVAKRITIAPSPSLKSKPAEKATETAAEAEKPDKKITSGAAATSTGSAAKKQSATSFLNRMKRSSNGTLMEMLKSSSSSGGGSGGGGRVAEHKKETKAEGRKGQSSRQGTAGSGKKAAETSSGGSAKRSVGRPPKRRAAQVTPASTKRRREEAEAETPSSMAGSTTARKRGRR